MTDLEGKEEKRDEGEHVHCSSEVSKLHFEATFPVFLFEDLLSSIHSGAHSDTIIKENSYCVIINEISKNIYSEGDSPHFTTVVTMLTLLLYFCV